MEKHHKFSIWYILLGIWVVLILILLVATGEFLALSYFIARPVSVISDSLAANLDEAIDGCAAGWRRDTIRVPAGTYVLTLPGRHEDGGWTGDLDLTDDTVVRGAGAGLWPDGSAGIEGCGGALPAVAGRLPRGRPAGCRRCSITGEK